MCFVMTDGWSSIQAPYKAPFEQGLRSISLSFTLGAVKNPRQETPTTKATTALLGPFSLRPCAFLLII